MSPFWLDARPALVSALFSRSVFAVVFSASALHPAALRAQEKSLHWRSIAVDARLDRDGALHVKETQATVFTGDWNGGERRFTVATGQRFDFERIVRVDSATGADVTLVGGDLERVDGFDFAGSHTIRWRSRLSSDPPFAGAERVYRLEYGYGNILVPEGDAFRLNHDFAFSDRDGAIEAFTLKLTLDSAWGAPADFTGQFGPVRLEPGSGFVVDLTLRHLAAGRPAGVVFGAGLQERMAVLAALAAGFLVLAVRFAMRERSLGRFAPAVPLSVVTDEWLQSRVLAHRPEVIGAAWDERTGAAEVTAVLARLEGEGKLKSRVETRKVLYYSMHTLHMDLLVDRGELGDYERSLIDALFSPKQKSTDTQAIRKRYQSSGFDPSTSIAGSVKQMVNRLAPNDVPPRRAGRRPTIALLAGAAACFVVAGVTRPPDLILVALGTLATTAVYLFALLQARLWQPRVERPLLHTLRFVIPFLALLVVFAMVVREDRLRSGVLVLAGLALLFLAAWHSVLAMAMWRRGPQRLQLRRELAAARQWFSRELQQSEPRLRDAWFPYLIAFGLGSRMDHWFKAFGGAARSSSGMASSSRSTSSSWSSVSGNSGNSGGSSGGWSGFGGGGGFAGGGSSGAWVAAASMVAGGVSKPSTRSSGSGSSGGGSSSGGGGGGGW